MTKMFLLFFLAQVIHILLNASISAKSSFTPWNTIRMYVAANRSALVSQLVVATGLFWLLLDNTAVLSVLIPQSVLSAPTMSPGLALVMGWFSDSFVEKFLSLFGLKSGA